MGNNEDSLIIKTTAEKIPLTSDLRSGYAAFIEELKDLEKKHYSSTSKDNEETYDSSITDNRELTQATEKPYYDLLVRVKRYANNGNKIGKDDYDLISLGDKEIAILNYIHSAILSRINQLKSNHSTRLVIDILGFTEIIESNIQDIKEQKQIEKIAFYRDGYTSQIEEKIKEAREFIDKLKAAIDKCEKDMNKKFDQLIEEIETLKRNAKSNKKRLKKSQTELRRQLVRKLIFGTVKTVTSMLPFIGPQCTLAASLVDSSSSIVQGFALEENKQNRRTSPTVIPESVKNHAISGWESYAKTKQEEAKRQLQVQLSIAEDFLAGNPNHDPSEALKEVKKKRDEIEQKLKLKPTNQDSDNPEALEQSRQELVRKLTEAYRDEKKAIERKLKDDNVKNSIQEKESAKYWIDKSEKIVNVVSAVTHIYDIYEKHRSDIYKLDKEIRNSKETFEKLKVFRRSIDEERIKMENLMKTQLKAATRDLQDKSHIALNFSSWDIQSNLKTIKHELDKKTSGFKTQGDFIYVVETISNAIAALVDIYDRIQDYQEQKQLVDYIANVNSSGVSIDPGEINELKLIILQNILLERYTTLISASKQWAFPFAKRFFNNINFMKDIQGDKSIEQNAEAITMVIKELKEKLRSYKTTVGYTDTKIVEANFGLGNAQVPAFFVWKSDRYADTIATLLEESKKGYESKEVTLISPVRASSYDAVKFNKVEIRIKHHDSNKQQQLDSCLDHFNCYLTPSASSYYRFNNKFYKLDINRGVKSEDKLQFMYGFQKDSNGSPYTKNKAYEKLERGELMLSPYSAWRVKLALVNKEGKNYFSDLEKYSGRVDVELVGTGSYVDSMTEKEQSDLSVDLYYQADDMVPILSALE